MIQDIPYFLTNKEWWYYDWDEMVYKLTDKATEEAKKSYDEFYKEVENDGNKPR